MADVKLFDSDVFSSLKRDAELSPRRRANYNVHEHYDDVVQRLFIAMMPDSYVRPHRHTQAHKWEFFMVLEGSIDILFFDDDGCLTKRVTLQAGGECCGLQIPPLTWHATVCDAQRAQDQRIQARIQLQKGCLAYSIEGEHAFFLRNMRVFNEKLDLLAKKHVF